MALSKKNKRAITVNGQRFYWAATEGDEDIRLIVTTEVQGNAKLLCRFGYHPSQIKVHGQQNTVALSIRFMVTPCTVHQSIEYALQSGWQPCAQGREVSLGFLDEKIDLRLSHNLHIYCRHAR